MYYRWRKEHSGLKVEQAKRLKDLEQENRDSAATKHILLGLTHKNVFVGKVSGRFPSCM